MRAAEPVAGVPVTVSLAAAADLNILRCFISADEVIDLIRKHHVRWLQETTP
jgi:hypothetical protein